MSVYSKDSPPAQERPAKSVSKAVSANSEIVARLEAQVAELEAVLASILSSVPVSPSEVNEKAIAPCSLTRTLDECNDKLESISNRVKTLIGRVEL